MNVAQMMSPLQQDRILLDVVVMQPSMDAAQTNLLLQMERISWDALVTHMSMDVVPTEKESHGVPDRWV